MVLNVSTAKTKRFIDWWVYIPSAIASFLLLLTMFGTPFTKTLVNKIVTLEEGDAIKVDTISLEPSKIGALRIDVKSYLANDERSANFDDWIVYEIQLIDRQGNIIASAMDEDWKEAGTWYEGGESGTWSESDLVGGIDLRSLEGEEIDVVIALLERKAAGQTDSSYRPTSFEVTIKNNVIDRRPLAWGFAWSGILAIVALYANRFSGGRSISQKIADSDPQGRSIVGGKDNLVRVYVYSRLDKHTPRKINLKLNIDNDYGERVYNEDYILPVVISKSDRGISGSVKFTAFFILEPYGSYRFKVDITPDAPVDRTYLEVRQRSKTVRAVDVTTITST